MEVCLVGAGPRGLSVLERLCAQERKSPRWEHLTVHVVDPDPPGSGRVWRPSQSRHLLMNTVASQVTVYTDASVTIDGPLEEGPSLYQWAKALGPSALTPGDGRPHDDQTLAEVRDLGPDTYPTRALYGHYLVWVFQQVTANAADHITVHTHRSRAIALDNSTTDSTRAQTVLLADGTSLTGLSAVVLAQGHVPAQLTPAERELTGFAARHGLTYIAPANPADIDLSGIAPGETVLLRGLGLNFFDYMALLTQGRGGTYTRTDGRLVYHPSGREPRLHAGSRRGVPYQARGDNEKGADGRYFPNLLTTRHIEELRTPDTRRRPIRFSTDLWPLISREVQSVYYRALLTARGEPPTHIAEFTTHYLHTEPGPASDQLLDEAHIPTDERWDWDKVARPYTPHDLSNRDTFRTWLRTHLDNDVHRAREGNVTGPFKAALDVLRDLRNEIRLAVDHGGLAADSHRDDLDRWYTPLNAYLSIGPPASRIEEMAALIDAGILDITGPGLNITTAQDPHPHFTGTSTEIPDVNVPATALIEARLPDTDLRRTADPLMRHLLRTGQCHPYRVPVRGGTHYETGGLAVTKRPYHLLDSHGTPHPRRFAYGVPTESVHWVTAAGIRPGVGSVTLEDSDAIAAAVLALPPLPAHTDTPTTKATTATGAPATSAGATP
ncbi:FAD/NAD(P)-binding protein [Streptomyces sp. B-S-A12]|uniref:FAD/NAD(P)-binding protein n=2 Tax=Streptomyces luteolus TaxID=3043615 RepID=A0ABT6T3Z9_9ACTN|nr:FAD/NAD(P)-binding protein [Streptomyces sp. B-S-A12]MDI3422598.1 FAD/NAD(P)-binding protein [Streptomyces sp. B-S-A12]